MSGLLLFQSLWATEDRRLGLPERPVAERFERVRDAGFDGMSIDLSSIPWEGALALVPEFARCDLRGLATAFPRSVEDIREPIRYAKMIDAPFLTVVGEIQPLGVTGMVPTVLRWLEIAAEEGLPLHLETHRASLTNDLSTTLHLLDEVPNLRLSADLSHYVVGREMTLPVSPITESWIRRILERADSFQGRIASGQQIQVPFGLPRYRPWLDQFLAWWSFGFARWRERHEADEDAVFLCELGPPEYALLDADGRELSDRWEEAAAMADMARAVWAETA